MDMNIKKPLLKTMTFATAAQADRRTSRRVAQVVG